MKIKITNFFKNIVYTIVVLHCPLLVLSQQQAVTTTTETVRWMTIDQAVKLQQAQPKTIMIDMYTDWCGWCKKMDQTTFSNPAIARYINDHFYPVKLNAETRDTLYYRDTMYVNNNTGQRPPHSLAVKLLGGRMSYPTTVYIDENFRVNAVPGYMDVGQIEPLLIYFAEKVYNTANYEDFQKNFKKTFTPDTVETNINGRIAWLSFDELNVQMEKNPRKVMLYIYHDLTPSSRVMSNTTFTHPIIAEIIGESYYAVKLDVTSLDTINFLGHTFTNDNEGPGHPHNLVIALLQPLITMPATVFFDEKKSLIYTFKGYYAPSMMELYLEFIRQNKYQNGNWQNFVNSYQRRVKD